MTGLAPRPHPRPHEPQALTRRCLLRAGLGAAAAVGLDGWRRPLQAAEEPEWVNWSGSVRARPRHVARPSAVEEVVAAVRQAAKAGEGVRVLGSGHSFVPLCATDGTAITLARMRGVEQMEGEKRQAVVLGGTKLYHLGRPLREAGLAIETLPDIDRQALAGAVATSTHGTGREVGSLSSLVEGVRLVTGNGEVVECSTAERPDLLAAARVSLGALGVITHLRMRLVPAFRLHERTWIAPYEETAAQLDRQIAAHRHFEFFWVSGRDACLLKTLDPTEQAEDVERYEDEEKLVGERVGWSDRIFPSARNTPFNEIEYAVPAERGPDCLAELRQLMLGKHREITWPLEYRTVAPDDAYLSQFYRRASVAISAHQAAALPYEPFFADVEAIFRNHRGRPHWGKIHRLEAAQLAELYPRWEAFEKARLELDPKGRFLNPYLRRLLVV